MNNTLSPLLTSLYLVLKLIEMNCRCRQGKGKEWEGGKHRDTKPVRPVESFVSRWRQPGG